MIMKILTMIIIIVTIIVIMIDYDTGHVPPDT